METGSFTSYIDVAQVTLYLFWAFFAGLIYYLHQENKREGYPLESDRSDRVTVQGWPPIPAPKTFLMRDGRTRQVPSPEAFQTNLAATPVGNWLGAPLQPTGNPMLDGIGPGSWNNRPDTPDLTLEDTPRIVPLRVATEFSVAHQDPDPRGMSVIGADGQVGGTVTDLWLDLSEAIFRYLEVSVPTAGGHRTVLLPMNFARVNRKQVTVQSITGPQFALVPGIRNPDQVTSLEEEKVMAYYGGGVLYAMPSRQEPLL